MNDAYTFETFVVAKSSREAFAAAISVAEDPGRVHNPLVLYGRSGCGKSHLLAALEHAIRTRFPAMNILRAPLHAFIAQLWSELRARNMPAFEDAMMGFDAILLDDLQFGSNQVRTEEAVFLILESARAAGAQIVIASQSPCTFASATMVEIGYPDVSARLELARREAAKHGLHLADDALREIAEGIEGSPTRIKSAVARIAATSLAATIPLCGSSSSPRLPLPQSPSS